MPDFVNQYLPPGVYVEEEATSLVSVVGNAPAVVGIYGPSVGYRTYTEPVTLTATAPTALTKVGIDPVNGFQVRTTDGTVVPGSDYDLVVGAGADSDEDILPDNTLTIARSVATGLADPETVFVSYRYTDADYTNPHRFRDFDDVKDFYGEPMDLTTGAITSPLSLAAKLAFENGAREVVLVATEGTADLATRAELTTAYGKMSGFFDVKVCVPLPVGLTGTALAPGDVINVGADLATAMRASDSDTLARVGLIGYESTVTVDPVTIAPGIHEKRVGVVWPQGMNYYNGGTNSVVEVSGYYLAAAIAGLMVSLPVQIPVTRKTVIGFSGISAAKAALMTKANKDLWSGSGLMVAEIDRANRLIVRHGTSSDPTSVLTREMSLVRAKDSMVTLIHDTMDSSGIIGTPINDETPIRIKGVMAGCLETLVGAGVIVAYNDLKVRQQSIDPTVVEVKFQYQPAYPLNYIVISFSINTLTGQTDLATSDQAA